MAETPPPAREARPEQEKKGSSLKTPKEATKEEDAVPPCRERHAFLGFQEVKLDDRVAAKKEGCNRSLAQFRVTTRGRCYPEFEVTEEWVAYAKMVAQARKEGLTELESDFETSVFNWVETSELDTDEEEKKDLYWVPRKRGYPPSPDDAPHLNAEEEIRRLREDNRLLRELFMALRRAFVALRRTFGLHHGAAVPEGTPGPGEAFRLPGHGGLLLQRVAPSPW